MPKNIVAPSSSSILMSIFLLKNVLNMVTTTLFDSDFGQRIKAPLSTRHTFNLTQHKSWHGIAHAQQVLEQLDIVHMWLQQFGFLAMSGIKLQQLDTHPRLTLSTSTIQKIFLILNLRSDDDEENYLYTLQWNIHIYIFFSVHFFFGYKNTKLSFWLVLWSIHIEVFHSWALVFYSV